MDQLGLWIERTLGIGAETQQRLLASLVAILILWIIHFLLRRAVIDQIKDQRARFLWQKLATYISFAVGLLVVGSVWIQGLQSLATYLGLVSAGLAVALKDPITDLMGWAFILWRRPFEVGDRIQIGEYAGDVIDQRVFKFSLMEIGNWVEADQSTGRILHIPNGRVFTKVLANYTKGSDFIWNEIPVLVTFESDWQKAKALLDEISRDHAAKIARGAEQSFKKAAQQYMIEYNQLGSIVYTSVKDSGVLLTIRYLCEPRKRRSSTEAIWENILREFAGHADIDFAYLTRRFYDNLREGKQAHMVEFAHERMD